MYLMTICLSEWFLLDEKSFEGHWFLIVNVKKRLTTFVIFACQMQSCPMPLL